MGGNYHTTNLRTLFKAALSRWTSDLHSTGPSYHAMSSLMLKLAKQHTLLLLQLQNKNKKVLILDMIDLLLVCIDAKLWKIFHCLLNFFDLLSNFIGSFIFWFKWLPMSCSGTCIWWSLPLNYKQGLWCNKYLKQGNLPSCSDHHAVLVAINVTVNY